jgi:small ligand-binding sensory domain FIST
MRDARTADEDLAMLLDTETIHNQPAGCLLLSCQARGTRLFSDHSHDARAVQRAFLETAGEEKAKGGSPVQLGNPVALAGMFAAGEIAPVGHEVFLHSQTAVAVMFRPIDH